jgi:hypothetical protein
MYPTLSTETIVIILASGFFGLVMFFAILRIFSIDKTLREILEILKTRYEIKMDEPSSHPNHELKSEIGGSLTLRGKRD